MKRKHHNPLWMTKTWLNGLHLSQSVVGMRKLPQISLWVRRLNLRLELGNLRKHLVRGMIVPTPRMGRSLNHLNIPSRKRRVRSSTTVCIPPKGRFPSHLGTRSRSSSHSQTTWMLLQGILSHRTNAEMLGLESPMCQRKYLHRKDRR